MDMSECVLFCFAFYNSGSQGKALKNVQENMGRLSGSSIYEISPRNLLCLPSSIGPTFSRLYLASSEVLGAG